MSQKNRSILEVWDYRLSSAQPMNYKGVKPTVTPKSGAIQMVETGTWVACVWDQGESRELLECHDTGVKVLPGGDADNPEGIDACYAFYRSVRDKYSRDDIEDLKPAVALIRKDDKLRQKATDAYNEVMKGKDVANDVAAGGA